jgi:alpha-tubulin suppressor-like RCC1 family protein
MQQSWIEDSKNPNVLTVTCGFFHTMILTKDNEIYSCGNNQSGQSGFGDRKIQHKLTKITY